MSVIRYTVVRPKTGAEEEVEKLLDELDLFCAERPGYLGSLRFATHDRVPGIGRLGLWATQHDADTTAVETHVLAIRSHINRISRQKSVEEVFDVEKSDMHATQVMQAA